MRKMTRNKDTKGCPLKNFPANPVSGSLIDLRLAKKPPHTHTCYTSQWYQIIAVGPEGQSAENMAALAYSSQSPERLFFKINQNPGKPHLRHVACYTPQYEL